MKKNSQNSQNNKNNLQDQDNSKKPRLQLNRKDLRTLDQGELKVAIGGWPGSHAAC